MKSKMKILSTFVLLTISVVCCKSNGDKNVSADLINNPNSASKEIDKSQLPKFKFQETEHDFGTVFQGEKVSYSFRFKNIGKSNLIISDAIPTCGCTVPDYPKTPIKPNEEGTIFVTFNTANRKGIQNKSVRIIANTQPNQVLLRIKAKVFENIENELVKSEN